MIGGRTVWAAPPALALVLALALARAEPASATAYEFSYQMDNGVSVAGSFDGNAAGAYVTGVSNVVLTINGNATGPVNVFGYYGEPSYAMSFDRTLTNFWFLDASADPNVSNGAYGFALLGSTISTPYAVLYGNNLEWANDHAIGIGDPAFPGAPMNDSWVLAAEVPEPATLALIGLGLAGLDLARRRAG